MTSIEIRVRDLYDDLNDSEKKAASFFLSHVDSVFVLPIAKLANKPIPLRWPGCGCASTSALTA